MGELLCLLILVILIAIACTWIGAKMVARALRTSKDPAIPQARTANSEGVDAAYAKAAHFATQAPRKVGKAALVAGGIALIAAPWIAIVAAIATFLSGFGDLGGGTKGRVLRIRGRARLPELATGDGWGERAVAIESSLTATERAVLGRQWLEAARMEHASIAAFAQLSLQLAALGAPARLVEATHRAALEEIDHAERCFAIARAITGFAHTAGPIIALGSSGSPSDHTELAVGSLVDGCLAEGIAADVAARGAALATEPEIRDTLAIIARDERGHAELAWDVLAWCLDVGGEGVQSVVAARVEALATELAPRAPAFAGVDDLVLARFGFCDQDALGRIAETQNAAVNDRARELLRAAVRAAA